ncbi:MAG: DUF47 domain-containing protein [bacterium]
MGLLQKYILPKEVDFDSALAQQAEACRQTVGDLARYCLKQDFKALEQLVDDEQLSRKLKHKNMHELLDVFITPYDKESIYRMITQLDWVALSVKHLAIEILAYEVECPDYYQGIFDVLTDMAEKLSDAFTFLPEKKLGKILINIESIHDSYDETTRACAVAAKRHLENDDIKVYLANKEILNQLKEVAKRLHISANTLEDMAIKIV